LVVADGVGGWKNMGINAGEYSKFLVENLKEIFSKKYNHKDKEKDKNKNYSNKIEEEIFIFDEKRLKEMIIEATEKTNLLGSSTLSTILIDNKNNCLYSAYIGDSVFMILRFKVQERRYYKLYKAKELSHTFNHPYQLGIKGDSPINSVIGKYDLDENDIIILATDG
jgi:protein phosphatase PTC7